MKKLQLFSIPILLAGIIFSACQKKTEPQTQSKSEMLTSSSWKFDKATSGGADVSGFINACYKDNIITFSAGGNGTLDEGASKCNSSDPQTTNFNWTLTSNETVLTVTGAIFAGQSGNFTIITLTTTQLVLEGTIASPGGNVTGQIHFKH